MFKIHINKAAPTIFSHPFESCNTNYNLRNASHFPVPLIRTLFNGAGNLPFFGSARMEFGPNSTETICKH